MNGGDIHSAVTSKQNGTVPLAIVTKKTRSGIMHQLYLAALNRPPTVKEADRVVQIFNSAPTRSRDALSGWQDLFWALLNSNEFMLNH